MGRSPCKFCGLEVLQPQRRDHETFCASNPAFQPRQCPWCQRVIGFDEQERHRFGLTDFTVSRKFEDHVLGCPENLDNACQYCGSIVEHWQKAAHESHCASNPVFAPRRCAVCCNFTDLHTEENQQRDARANFAGSRRERPRSSAELRRKGCQHCGRLLLQRNKASHECTCAANPSLALSRCCLCAQSAEQTAKVRHRAMQAGALLNEKFEEWRRYLEIPEHSCKHCGRVVQDWQLATHEQSCARNPVFAPRQCPFCKVLVEVNEKERQTVMQTGLTVEKKLEDHLQTCPENCNSWCRDCGIMVRPWERPYHGKACKHQLGTSWAQEGAKIALALSR